MIQYRGYTQIVESWYVMKLPKEGDFITIQSYKHDGSLHRTWRDTMVLKITENAIIGVNDHTLVTESDGRRGLHVNQQSFISIKNIGLTSSP